MSMSTTNGLSAADVAAVVDGRNGGYNDGFAKHYGSADIGFRSKYYDRSP